MRVKILGIIKIGLFLFLTSPCSDVWWDTKVHAASTCSADRRSSSEDGSNTNNKDCAWGDADVEGFCNAKYSEPDEDRPPIPPDCRVVMAPSPLHGYGIFTVDTFRRGQPLLPGDVVIQLSDIPASKLLQFAATHYWWSAADTAGFYEGKKVASVAPGVGMLANGAVHNNHQNVLPAVPVIDEAGLTRTASPGAGAVTPYHNWTWYVQLPVLPAGSEVLVNYGSQWLQERRGTIPMVVKDSVATENTARNVTELRQDGWCLDSMKAGQSALRDAGRGAFATRYLPEGSVVAPVPVLVIPRDALRIIRAKDDDTVAITQQLLLNYCWGHAKSSLLLYPLINHSGGKRANVRLQWVDSVDDVSIIDALQRPWLLELIAKRPIRKDEEIVLDYGVPWIEAWIQHVHNSWHPITDEYAPSYVMDDVVQVLRTEEELKSHPYPENIFTSCYYRYKDDRKIAEQQASDGITTFRWEFRRGLFEPRNLRPCRILQRHETGANKDQLLFTVQVRNRYGLDPEERIPTGQTHILTNVPRNAIRFSDKLYTTDPHLPNAFRHPMGNLEYPEGWKDLKHSTTTRGKTTWATE